MALPASWETGHYLPVPCLDGTIAIPISYGCEEPMSKFRARAWSFISGQQMNEEATIVPCGSGGGDPIYVILGKLCE